MWELDMIEIALQTTGKKMELGQKINNVGEK